MKVLIPGVEEERLLGPAVTFMAAGIIGAARSVAAGL
jgi:hypothetical protein